MPKRLNQQPRKLTLAMALLLVAASLPGCDYFHPVTDAEYVAKAKASQDAGDLKASVLNLKNALLKNPDNIEARQMLGEINVTLGNGADAEKELRKAMELGVKPEYLLLSLAKALSLQQKYQQVIDEITAPLNIGADGRATLMAYRGEAWIGLNKLDQAKAEFEQALVADGKSSLAKLGLARLSFASNEVDKALQLAKEAVDASPSEAAAWSLLAELYKSKGDLNQAEASYSKAIELPGSKPSDRANRALLRIDMKKLEEAGQDIEVLTKQAPNFFLTHFAAGILNLAQKKHPEAQASLEVALRLNERYVQANYFLALSQFYQQHWDQAEQSLSRFLNAFPNSIKGYQLMALLKIQKKDYAAAQKFITPVVAKMPDDILSLKALADIEFALGHTEQGLAHLKKLAELEPKSAETKAQLGLGLLGAGKKEEALEALQTAVSMDPNLIQADVNIVISYVRGKQYEQAQAVIDKLKMKMPESAVPVDLEGLIYMTKGEIENAKHSFERALIIAPQDLNAANSLANLALREKNVDKAIELYQQILKYHPKHVPALLVLAELQANKGKFQDTETYLKQAIEAAPESRQARVYLARLYNRFGQAQKALALLEKAPTTEGENEEFLATLAETQLENNSNVQALETTKKLVKGSPKSPLAHYLMARAYAENGDVKSMRAALEVSLKQDAKFFRSRLAMVRLLAQENKGDLASKYLADLKAEFPENPEVLELQGWFALQQRKPEEALKGYQAAFDKFPSGRNAANLAQAQWAAGQKDLAISTLGQWIEKYPKDVSVRFALSRLYLALKQPDKAKVELKAILELKPDNTLSLNALAWILLKENPDEALEYAEKAMSMAPKSPVIIDTLAMILLEKGQNERALSLIEQADSLSHKHPTIRYHLAQVYERNNRIPDATKVLTELLKNSPHFEEKKEAEQLLNRLKSGS